MAQLIPPRFKRLAYQKIPARLLKYQIALRNYRRGEPEIRLLRQLVDRNRDAADVGAYLGAYTFFLCRLARDVQVFEPQAACADFLSRAYRGRVTVHRVALSDHTGRAILHSRDERPDQAATLVGGDLAIGQEVSVRRLDDYAFNDLGFIKLMLKARRPGFWPAPKPR